MEISKIKISGAEVNVLFTGTQYIFHNPFFGLLAVAERISKRKDNTTRFILSVDNYNTASSFAASGITAACKRFINKSENRYVATVVEYDEHAGNINREYYIDCVARPRE